MGGKQKVSKTITVEPLGGSVDTIDLAAKLGTLKQKYPGLAEPNVTAHTSVIYKDLVRVVEATKKSFPKVYLAGNYEE
jgi:hypothetical protein